MLTAKVRSLFRTKDNGLMGALEKALNVSWFDDEFAKHLNEDYFLIRSGRKTLNADALLIAGMTDDRGEIFTDDDGASIVENDYATLVSGIASVLSLRFGVKWKEKYSLITKTYNLEADYHIVRERTPELTTKGKTSRSTESVSTTKTDTENQNQGFNSESYNPDSKQSSEGSSSVKESPDANFTEGTSTVSGHEMTTEERTKGDITDRIAKALALRNVIIADIIENDIDKVIAIPYYEY